MNYLGGKAQIARKLTAAINREVGSATPCWEPFMGSGGMTEQLARTRRGTASDAHAALMSMWIALQNGWVPPVTVTHEMYKRARELPDSDPTKAFIGFGCSFGGKWFAGFAKDLNHVDTRWRPGASGKYRVVIAQRSHSVYRSVRRAARLTRHWTLECCSFFDRKPEQRSFFIYADPPYADTTGYSTGTFRAQEFWERCREWSQFVPVIASEYACSVPHQVLYETRRSASLSRTLKIASDSADAPVERLFRVLPPQPRMRMRRSAA